MKLRIQAYFITLEKYRHRISFESPTSEGKTVPDIYFLDYCQNLFLEPCACSAGVLSPMCVIMHVLLPWTGCLVAFVSMVLGVHNILSYCIDVTGQLFPFRYRFRYLDFHIDL